MGAALTYARRYFLFTMVGIAGEDDNDAPDLPTTNVTGVPGNGLDPEPVGDATDLDASRSSFPPNAEESGNTGERASALHDSDLPRRRRRVARRSPPSHSPFAQSSDPLGDLASIADADSLFRWSLEVLPARNKLDGEERATLDAAFPSES
jgi:hypothetical protein